MAEEILPVEVGQSYLSGETGNWVLVVTLVLELETSDVRGPSLFCTSHQSFDCNDIVKIKEKLKEE